MTKALIATILVFLLIAMSPETAALAYTVGTTIPAAGGCPQPNHWSLSLASPLSRRWSTSLPTTAFPVILTVAAQGTAAQLNEIEQAVSDSFGMWTGVTGTTFNTVANPGLVAPLTRVSNANSCTNDAESNVDGIDTICFNQSSMGFTSGVLAFTRVITAAAPGATVGSSPPAAFAGQILDSDTLLRNDGQATFATPGALGTAQGQGAYDFESILAHELGHWFGLAHSAVWRAMMFPFSPPPGQFLGVRPTAQAPDGPLGDDDRTGIRVLYPDPNDAVNIGTIQGKILPANAFAFAEIPASSTGSAVTGIFGAHVVAVDTATGSVIAGTLGGWSCNAANPPTQFDGTFSLERLPVGHSYQIYAEPIIGLVGPGDFGDALDNLCSTTAAPTCTTPNVNTNFNVRIRPSGP
jgi:matrixin